MYLARGCHRSYCACSALPIASSALAGCIASGLIQHSMRAHGEILSTSGGSTPMLRHITSATDVVFMRSFMRQRETSAACSARETPAPSRHTSADSCRSSQKNSGYSDSCISGDIACIAPPSALGPCTEFSRDCVSSAGDCRSRVPSSLLRGDRSPPRGELPPECVPSKGRRCCWCDRRGDTGGSIATEATACCCFAISPAIADPYARDTRGPNLLTHLRHTDRATSRLASYLRSRRDARVRGVPPTLHARVPLTPDARRDLGFRANAQGGETACFARDSLFRCLAKSGKAQLSQHYL